MLWSYCFYNVFGNGLFIIGQHSQFTNVLELPPPPQTLLSTIRNLGQRILNILEISYFNPSSPLQYLRTEMFISFVYCYILSA